MLPEILATLVLIAAVATPLAALAVTFLRSPYTPAQTVLHLGNVLLSRILWRTSAPAQLPIEAERGAVLVCNHRSSVDPFFVQLVAGRKVHWMVAREYCEHPAFAWFLKTCEVIPVRRGGVDTASTKSAIRLASEGGLIGMFPEGRINMTGDFMLPCRPGAVLIALRAGVPLLPVYIEGSPYNQVPWSPFFLPARVKVRFGRLIELSYAHPNEKEKQLAQRLLADCIRQLATLAGRPDYQVRLAGRDWKPTAADLQADMAASARRQRRQ